ncbi:hypothetical protein ZIOFF_070890 [Zingiber officinale]|uniref:Myb/SANT-like domain-containing protein n=1 Tax=Zingiber officinale TaxID=94328 RepID=A0A8J5CAY6_ZINOF|nr:hypothetical protein ZIOFF_070890 [Zingiber officinale]
MLNHSSAFGWNDVEKCIITTKDVFDDWVKSHPAAIGLRNKEFPHLDDLMFVWEKDRATRANAETPSDAVEEMNLCDEETHTFGHEKDEHTECQKDEESDHANQAIRKSEILDSSIYSQVCYCCYEANEEMKGISTYFKKQIESGDRKMKIYDELIKLFEFSEQEIMDVGQDIFNDEYKIDNFFALSKAFRRNYVIKHLNEIHPN